MVKNSLFFSILFILTSFTYGLSNTINSPFLFNPKGIAIVHLESVDGNTAISSVGKDEKVLARMRVVNSVNSTYDSTELYSGYIKIKGRGNSTWGAPKKPYNIDLVTEDDEDNPSSLLGMPADEEWALIANHFDKSLLRIPLAYNLGNLIGMDYSPRLHHVEVYIDGTYNGLYCLSEKIKRSKDRVDIKKLNAESSKNQISGGYIVEITPQNRLSDSDSTFSTNIAEKYFTIKYPKAKNISAEQKKWIENYIISTDSAIYTQNSNDTILGFRNYLDENSIIDWFLINELAKNNDAAMFASVFLYKERNEKLKFGPVWDFDIAFGNVDYNENWHENDLWITNAVWFNQFNKDSLFKEKVRLRYEELKNIFDSIPQIIQANAEHLITSGAVERNFNRWNILGTKLFANKEPYPNTYEGEIMHLTD